MKTEKKVNLSANEGLKETTQPNKSQVYRNQRGGRRLGFQWRKPINQDKSSGSGGKYQTGGKRKNGPGNQGQLEQFGGSKQARMNFEQWPLCNKCKRRNLGDYNDLPKCYNYGNSSHLARNCQNYYNCSKPGHLAKDCLNCYNYGKLGTFARDCPKQGKFGQKQGNARVYALTQGEVEASTSKVVAGQISIAHTSTYTFIDSGASHSFESATFVKKLNMVPNLLDEMCIVSLPLGKNLTSRFSFKVVPVKVTGRELLIDLIVLNMVDYDVILGID